MPHGLVSGIGQQRYRTGALDSYRELALVLGAGAGHAARKDLAALVYVTAQMHELLVVYMLDLVDTELAHLAARPAATRPARGTIASILRPFRHRLHRIAARQKGSSSLSTCVNPPSLLNAGGAGGGGALKPSF